jgi:hypothetical protein
MSRLFQTGYYEVDWCRRRVFENGNGENRMK